MNKIYPNLSMAIRQAARELATCGHVVKGKSWHAQKAPAPMIELLNHSFIADIPVELELLRDQVQPNLPWADEHFLERVGGKPLNPPPSHVRWPFAVKGNEMHGAKKVFSHSYPERMWPVFAGKPRRQGTNPNRGIRYEYGSLEDLVMVLVQDPLTRQAYLPIWFPEDLSAAFLLERVPCTLGYHFIRRDRWLHMVYPMRSCDFVRHFRDDVYMACRLLQWVLQEVKSRYNARSKSDWDCVIPGTLKMDITSLHAFEHERDVIRVKELRNEEGSHL